MLVSKHCKEYRCHRIFSIEFHVYVRLSAGSLNFSSLLCIKRRKIKRKNESVIQLTEDLRESLCKSIPVELTTFLCAVNRFTWSFPGFILRDGSFETLGFVHFH